MEHFEEVWRFDTANFSVRLEIAPEDMDPAHSFEFEEDIEAVRSGEVDWFCARVRVLGPTGEELGASYLGGCAYKPASDFWTAHRGADPMARNCSIVRAERGENACIGHYFPSMVTDAVAEARANVARVKGLRLRAA